VFGVKTAYAVDQGLGGIVKGFSNVSPVLTANIESYSSTELTLAPGATTTSTVRITGSHHHADHASSGIGGLTVTFSASGGSTLSAATATTAADGTASVNWTMPATGTGPYTLTADGPALGGPVTFTATVVPLVGNLIDFESYPNESPACGGAASCDVTNEFAGPGVVFSFDQILPGETNASLCNKPFNPIGETPNYGVSPHATVGCSTWNSGTVTMSFASFPTAVEFQLQGNNSLAAGPFPVTALDANGNAVTVTRESVVTYSPSTGLTFRREIRLAFSAVGIASVSVISSAGVIFIDNLLIVP
jgi:hypothetical protein